MDVIAFLKLVFFTQLYQSRLLLLTYKFWKAVLGIYTNTTELFRICANASDEAGLTADWYQSELTEEETDSIDSDRTPLLNRGPLRDASISVETVFRVDRSILYSSRLVMERRTLESLRCDLDEITQTILYKKNFPENGSTKTPSAMVLHYCLTQIRDSYKLAHEINDRATTKFDSNNKQHEKKLLELWDLLMPDEQLEGRYSEQWTKIGFQGKDPATDFRGMGMLGLDDLVYYAKNYPESAHDVLKSSRRNSSWRPFATVGINITFFAVQTLRTRQLQYFLFKYGSTKDIYHEFFCYLFHSFNEFWISHDQSTITIMDFEKIFNQFKRNIIQELLNRKSMVLDSSKDMFIQYEKTK
ncbi:ELMO/CED-12 family-domain-containing protein [Gigaspora rosea]|uniref:ELMO/CED-12 family-domain-containing protein n=1 Tax=Gigaspora rosea TaxID=44941 RepID=A0A397V5L2_9GLOM|nr:ELMO/CED-12 family-domain-containing protein [Gigaspora rosea]